MVSGLVVSGVAGEEAAADEVLTVYLQAKKHAAEVLWIKSLWGMKEKMSDEQLREANETILMVQLLCVADCCVVMQLPTADGMLLAGGVLMLMCAGCLDG